MKPIPISAAEKVAKQYGYDQVIIIARKVGDNPEPHGEHVTTYGVNKEHCSVAAKVGDFLKYKVMGWVRSEAASQSITRSLLSANASRLSASRFNASVCPLRDRISS